MVGLDGLVMVGAFALATFATGAWRQPRAAAAAAVAIGCWVVPGLVPGLVAPQGGVEPPDRVLLESKTHPLPSWQETAAMFRKPATDRDRSEGGRKHGGAQVVAFKDLW